MSRLPGEEASVQVRQNVEQAQKYVKEKKFEDLEHPEKAKDLLLIPSRASFTVKIFLQK